MRRQVRVVSALITFSLLAPARPATAEAPSAPRTKDANSQRSGDTPADVLSPDQWRRVDAAVKRALNWLASQQQPDGSFPTMDMGQPGVTSLCILAFMAHGHGPGEGEYGKQIDRAVNYVLLCRKDNGLISLEAPEGPEISRNVGQELGNTIVYNHAISSLTLSELYGSTKTAHAARIESAIKNALAATLEMQQWPKDRPDDKGGWRYLKDYDPCDSDLSVTGWQLKFLRSARNAGFNVPEEPIKDAIAFIQRCYDKKYGAFVYSAGSADSRSRGTAGAGILALAHAGLHNAPEALQTGDWVLAQGFKQYNVHANFNRRYVHDRYHYGLFMCCQGMYQLGGRYWESFFPPVVETLLANQRPNGSWPAENHHYDARYGNAYTTALVLLTLGAPNQLLPIYQR
jgi:hypothetical protein